MKIDIKDLGYVKNVSLDLSKDLTILCGPNNTGKTYVSYAVYGLMNFRSELPHFQLVTEEIKTLFTKGKIELNIVEILTKNNSDYLESIGKNYSKNISKVFASDDTTFEKTEVIIKLSDIDNFKAKILKKEVKQEFGIRNSFSVRIVKEIGSPILTCLLIEKEKIEGTKQEYPTTIFVDLIGSQITSLFIDLIFSKTFIVPAERIAINIFSKELSLKRNVLVDKLLELKDVNKDDDPFDYIKRRATRYPLPIRDSLEISEDLNNYKKNKSEFEYFADEIEKDILKGSVLISKDGDVQFKPDKARTLKLPIHLTATVVKSLSNLVIYFRHLANTGDFIIIDEPELNLHPDNQVIIAKIIAKIVNKGFKVLISTHSDYIIRELNNLIMLNSKPQFLKRYNYHQDYLLDFHKVEAVLFTYNSRKCLNLEVNETGFEVETIDSVINDLNERSQDLFFNSEPIEL